MPGTTESEKNAVSNEIRSKVQYGKLDLCLMKSEVKYNMVS